MLSNAQIAAGAARLVANKLTLSDVDQLVQNFRLLVGYLETANGYSFVADLTAIDDTDGRGRAAKLAAVLVLLINDGFKVLKLTGKNNVALSKEDQRRLTILFAFALLYPIPVELTQLQTILNSTLLSYSGTIERERVW